MQLLGGQLQSQILLGTDNIIKRPRMQAGSWREVGQILQKTAPQEGSGTRQVEAIILWDFEGSTSVLI